MLPLSPERARADIYLETTLKTGRQHWQPSGNREGNNQETMKKWVANGGNRQETSGNQVETIRKPHTNWVAGIGNHMETEWKPSGNRSFYMKNVLHPVT